MFSDRIIREAVWPTQGRASVFVPSERAHFGPIDDSQIQPASLDVRLGEDFIRHPCGERITVGAEGYSMAPGECLLGTLVERMNMNYDNVVARIEGKSSWARQFLTVHAAGFIDPGFCGDVTLELKNDGHARLHLSPGVMIAQISFHFLAAPAQRLYGDKGLRSHYQNQKGATPSWRSDPNTETP